MGEDAVCDYPGCGAVGDIISRLSPEGYLVATGKKAYSFERHTGASIIAEITTKN
jgi:hypothetical protein